MAAIRPPVCEFNQKLPAFSLPDTEGKVWTPENALQENGLLVMFICNHCPYVKSILPQLVKECRQMQEVGVGVVAIMANDINDYPEDAPENMKTLATQMGFSFPYLFDESQNTAKTFGAVCTPDFFGYNKEGRLQYRGQFDDRGTAHVETPTPSDLLQAMQQIAKTDHGPQNQRPSIGCSIKWRKEG